MPQQRPHRGSISNKKSSVPTRQQLSTRNARTEKHKKTVGNYILGKSIGEGTFGKVKAGQHILTGEKVSSWLVIIDCHTTNTEEEGKLTTHLFTSGCNKNLGEE